MTLTMVYWQNLKLICSWFEILYSQFCRNVSFVYNETIRVLSSDKASKQDQTGFTAVSSKSSTEKKTFFYLKIDNFQLWFFMIGSGEFLQQRLGI